MEITYKLILPRDGASIPVVRHICRDTLVELGIEQSCIGDIEVAVSEACTNVLKHAAAADVEYTVEILVNERNCEISVIDTGTGFDFESFKERPAPDSAAEGGRGLQLMDALVDDLRFVSTPEKGTIVHIEKKLDFTPDSLLLELSSRASAHEYLS